MRKLASLLISISLIMAGGIIAVQSHADTSVTEPKIEAEISATETAENSEEDAEDFADLAEQAPINLSELLDRAEVSDEPAAEPSVVENVTVKVKAPSAWNTPYLWAWTMEGGQAKNAFTSFPGQQMTKSGDWYTCSMPNWVTHCIVSNGTDQMKSKDLVVNAGSNVWLTVSDKDNVAVDYNDPTPPPPPAKKKFTVTFDSKGGSTVANQEVEENKTATKPNPDPTKTNFNFKGWYKQGETAEYNFSQPVTGNMTLEAKWEAKPVAPTKHTVTFDTDGGSKIDAVQVEHGKPVAKPATNPSKEGNTFIGWYKDEQQYDFNTAVTTDITLKANWEAVLYKVTFKYEDGTTSDVVKQVEYGKKLLDKPTDPSRTGHKFKGWFKQLSDTAAFDFETLIKSDIELHAKWEADPSTPPAPTNVIKVTDKRMQNGDWELEIKDENDQVFPNGSTISIVLNATRTLNAQVKDGKVLVLNKQLPDNKMDNKELKVLKNTTVYGPAKVNVPAKQALPETKTIEVKQGTAVSSVEPKQGIKNADTMPNHDKVKSFTFKTAPKTDKVGKTDVTIVITYKDDSVTEVTTKLEVIAVPTPPTPTPWPDIIWPRKYYYSVDLLSQSSLTYNRSSDTYLDFRFDASPFDLRYVKIDGETLDDDDYLVYRGSTVIRLKPEYLDKLSKGRHTIKALFKRTYQSYNVGESEFYVLGKYDKLPKPGRVGKTGELANTVSVMSFLFISLAFTLARREQNK